MKSTEPLIRKIKHEIQQHSRHLDFDISHGINPDTNTFDITSQFLEAVAHDREEAHTTSSTNWVEFSRTPWRSWICNKTPKFAKKLVCAILRPRVESVLCSYEAHTEAKFQRVCPHTGEGGHGQFLYGLNLAMTDHDEKDAMWRVAARSQQDDVMDVIRRAVSAHVQYGYHPTTVALGYKEVDLLLSDPYAIKRGEWDMEKVWGLTIERVNRKNYLSVY